MQYMKFMIELFLKIILWAQKVALNQKKKFPLPRVLYGIFFYLNILR